MNAPKILSPAEGDRAAGRSVEAQEPSMTPNPEIEGLAERLEQGAELLREGLIGAGLTSATLDQAAALLRSQASSIDWPQVVSDLHDRALADEEKIALAVKGLTEIAEQATEPEIARAARFTLAKLQANGR